MNTTNILETNYWRKWSEATAMEAVTLHGCNTETFQIHGNRLAARIIEMLARHALFPFDKSTILEIGCGQGRFLVPMSRVFGQVIGVDLSQRILKDCESYLAANSVQNFQLYKNNGSDLSMIEDASLEYCFSTGVFQHVILLEVILGYVQEALRVLKTDGLFLFQFQAFKTAKRGHGTTGARLTAFDLDKTLNGFPYEIMEMSCDSKDPYRQLFIILRKTNGSTDSRSFADIEVQDIPFRTGVFEDLEGFEEAKALWERFVKHPEERPVTFYDQD